MITKGSRSCWNGIDSVDLRPEVVHAFVSAAVARLGFVWLGHHLDKGEAR